MFFPMLIFLKKFFFYILNFYIETFFSMLLFFGTFLFSFIFFPMLFYFGGNFFFCYFHIETLFSLHVSIFLRLFFLHLKLIFIYLLFPRNSFLGDFPSSHGEKPVRWSEQVLITFVSDDSTFWSVCRISCPSCQAWLQTTDCKGDLKTGDWAAFILGWALWL